MKCFRIKLTDRREVPAMSSNPESPRRYCQRRLINSSLAEQDWIKHIPQRFHLDSFDKEESDDKSCLQSPSFEETKNTNCVFAPAFLTITNLDLRTDILTTESKPKRCFRYTSVPKSHSAHLHRMFVKSNLISEQFTRCSSQSTEYGEYEFEEYMREYDSLTRPEFSFLQKESKTPSIIESPNNNNDSQFINKNDDLKNISTPVKSPVGLLLQRVKESQTDRNSSTSGNRRREKRRSLTLSRIPSPETIQVIRIDVISGYPVSSDNSVLSEFAENECSEKNLDLKFEDSYSKEVQFISHGTQTDINMNDTTYKNTCSLGCEKLFNCKSLNLSKRLLTLNRSFM